MRRKYPQALIGMLVFLVANLAIAVDVRCEFLFDQQGRSAEDAQFTALLQGTRNFTTDRGMARYRSMFHVKKTEFPVYSSGKQEVFELDTALAALAPGDVWLDLGTGKGNVHLEMLSVPGFAATMIGIDLAPASTDAINAMRAHPGRYRLLGGHSLEQLASSGQLMSALPRKAKLVTSLFGPDTYSRHLDQVVQIAADATAVGGLIAMTLPTESYGFNFTTINPATRIEARSEFARAKTAVEKRTSEYIRMRRGYYRERHRLYRDSGVQAQKDELRINMKSDISYMTQQYAGVLGWFEAIQGLEIVAVGGLSEEAGLLFVLRKTSAAVSVPSLKLERYEYDVGPAHRVYSW
jgi:hypothetical protein